MCIQQLAEFSKEMLSPVIAIGMFYIAWQQYKTNRQKFVLDRYDRRLKVYEEVRQILRVLVQGGNTSNYDDLLKFYRAVSEADFLFGPEISEYIDEVYKHGVKFQSWNKQYRDYTQLIPPGYDHQAVCDGMRDEELWLSSQFEPAKQKFKKYLDVSQ